VNIVALHLSQVTDLIREGLSFLMCMEDLLCDSTAQPQCSTSLHTPGTSYVLKVRSPTDLVQVTSVAKKPDTVAQSNSFVDVELEMQLMSIKVMGCAILLQ